MNFWFRDQRSGDLARSERDRRLPRSEILSRSPGDWRVTTAARGQLLSIVRISKMSFPAAVSSALGSSPLP
jgi:hypothetical protein